MRTLALLFVCLGMSGAAAAQGAGAWLHFGEGTAGIYEILDEGGGVERVVEVIGASPLQLGLAPGRYQVRKATPRGLLVLDLELGAGDQRVVQDKAMRLVAWPAPPAAPPLPARPLLAPPPFGVMALPVEDDGAARARAVRRRSTGAILLGSGLGLMLIGGLTAGLGSQRALVGRSSKREINMVVGVGVVVGGFALVIPGAIVLGLARGDLRRLDERPAYPRRFSLVPVFLPGGLGLASSIDF